MVLNSYHPWDSFSPVPLSIPCTIDRPYASFPCTFHSLDQTHNDPFHIPGLPAYDRNDPPHHSPINFPKNAECDTTFENSPIPILIAATQTEKANTSSTIRRSSGHLTRFQYGTSLYIFFGIS